MAKVKSYSSKKKGIQLFTHGTRSMSWFYSGCLCYYHYSPALLGREVSRCHYTSGLREGYVGWVSTWRTRAAAGTVLGGSEPDPSHKPGLVQSLVQVHPTGASLTAVWTVLVFYPGVYLKGIHEVILIIMIWFCFFLPLLDVIHNVPSHHFMCFEGVALENKLHS